jgi:hypothetical protein
MTQFIRIPTRVESPDQQKRLVSSALDAPSERNCRVVSGSFTVQDEDDVILVSAVATITLPAPATVLGRTYTIVRTGGGLVTYVAADGALLAGSASRTLTVQWESIDVFACATDGGSTFGYILH